MAEIRIQRISELLRRFAFLLAILTFAPLASACGPDWTYIGHPEWEILCITSSNTDAAQYLCGTWAGSITPGSGGVYRYAGHDTTWIYSGLADHRVWKLKKFPAYPNAIFAVASGGLYRSDDDGSTWSFITQVSRWINREPIDFAISPYDSTEWVCATSEFDLANIVYLSQDAGQTWRSVLLNYAKDLTYSRLVVGRLYFHSGRSLYRAQIADSEFTIVDSIGSGNVFRSMVQHPSRSWYFALAGHVLVRYDEVTGESIHRNLPDSMLTMDRLIFTADTELVMGGGSGMFIVSEDLSVLTPMPLPVPTTYASLEFATNQSWVARCYGDQWFCRSAETAVDPGRVTISKSPIMVYPNPARESISFQIVRPSQIVVYNILGQQVYRGQSLYAERTLTWTMNPPVSGTYYFRIESLTCGNMPVQTGTFSVVK